MSTSPNVLRSQIGILEDTCALVLFVSRIIPTPYCEKFVTEKSRDEFQFKKDHENSWICTSSHLVSLFRFALWILYGFPFVRNGNYLFVISMSMNFIIELIYIIVYLVHADKKQRFYVYIVLVGEIIAYTGLLIGLRAGGFPQATLMLFIAGLCVVLELLASSFYSKFQSLHNWLSAQRASRSVRHLGLNPTSSNCSNYKQLVFYCVPVFSILIYSTIYFVSAPFRFFSTNSVPILITILMTSPNVLRSQIGILGDICTLALFFSHIPTPYCEKIVSKKARDESQFKKDPENSWICTSSHLGSLSRFALWILYDFPFVRNGNYLFVMSMAIGFVIELLYFIIYLVYADKKQRFYVYIVLVSEIIAYSGLVIGLRIGGLRKATSVH